MREENVWFLIILILCAAIAVFLALRRKKSEDPPLDTYVCDICGEKDCLCRKEQRE